MYVHFEVNGEIPRREQEGGCRPESWATPLLRSLVPSSGVGWQCRVPGVLLEVF